MEQTYSIPASLVRAIGNYLAERPYREVVELLNALQAAVTPARDVAPADTEQKDAA